MWTEKGDFFRQHLHRAVSRNGVREHSIWPTVRKLVRSTVPGTTMMRAVRSSMRRYSASDSGPLPSANPRTPNAKCRQRSMSVACILTYPKLLSSVMAAQINARSGPCGSTPNELNADAWYVVPDVWMAWAMPAWASRQ